MTDALLAFINTRLDEDELWALAASAPHHGDDPTVPGGVHWTWAVGDNWTPVTVDPTASYVGEGHEDEGGPTLVTREEFPLTWSAQGLANRVIACDEMRTGEAGHIVRHDPASVLLRVDAARRRMALIATMRDGAPTEDDGPFAAMAYKMDTMRAWALYRIEAMSWSEHPDFDPSWRQK